MIELKDFEIIGSRDFRLRVGSFTISGGQFIQVSGKNQTGKSLLLKTIAGKHRNYTGKLLYNGLEEKPGKYSVILIDEYPAYLADESVRRNLYLPLKKISERKKKQLEEMLKASDLEKVLEDKMFTLSRSEVKGLELVRAIIQQPHFILFDDFDTYFDNISLENLTAAFDYAAKTGTAIIITAKSRYAGIKNNYLISAGELYKQ
jgi:ABC-type multidrug transport system ATPase subunit